MTAKDYHQDVGERKLKIAIMITVSMLVIEVMGYLLSNSLALLTDAGHVLLHVVGLSISFYAIRIACRPPTQNATYGHHRVEPLVALVNAITIIVLAFIIFYEAYNRLLSPPTIRSFEMLMIATIGLIGNLAVVAILRGPKDLNIRSAYLHVIADTLSSFAVVIGGIIIMFTGILIIDPMLSIFVGGIMLFSALQLTRESIEIIMERVPKHVNMDKLRSDVCGIEGVVGIHDIHVWSLCSHVHVMSAHVVVDETDVNKTQEIIDRINTLLRDKFMISHSALQLECEPCDAPCEVKH